jgi:hypothetical protein
LDERKEGGNEGGRRRRNGGREEGRTNTVTRGGGGGVKVHGSNGYIPGMKGHGLKGGQGKVRRGEGRMLVGTGQETGDTTGKREKGTKWQGKGKQEKKRREKKRA